MATDIAEDGIAVGAWEHAMLQSHAIDDSMCVNWTVALDVCLEPTLVAAALAAIAPSFPRYFARAQQRGDRWVLMPGPPEATLVFHRDSWLGGARGIAGRLARTRLDPERHGLFRCHLFDGPQPVLAFQATHVVGDGYTNHSFRTAFASAVSALSKGAQPQLPPPAALVGAVEPELVIASLTSDPRAFAAEVPQIRRLVLPLIPVQADVSEIRVLRAVVSLEEFAPTMKRAVALSVSPVSLLLAALVGATRDVFLPLNSERGEYLAPQLPRDFRSILGRTAAADSFVYPQSVPVLATDPTDVAPLARAIHSRIQRGSRNRLMYRHFFHQLKMSEKPNTSSADGFNPFTVFGATEIPNRGSLERMGPARVLETVFQTPILTRRYADGKVHLGCALRWTAAAQPVLQRLLDGVMSRLFDVPVCWELL
jgi:hypothetical protein